MYFNIICILHKRGRAGLKENQALWSGNLVVLSKWKENTKKTVKKETKIILRKGDTMIVFRGGRNRTHTRQFSKYNDDDEEVKEDEDYGSKYKNNIHMLRQILSTSKIVQYSKI